MIKICIKDDEDCLYPMVLTLAHFQINPAGSVVPDWRKVANWSKSACVLELYTELMMTQVLEKSDEVSVSSISLKKPDKFYHFPHFSIQLYEGI